jgi:hypothetical protein
MFTYLAAGVHHFACAICAELLKRAVQNADGIVEVHCVDCKPFIQVLSWWQLDSLCNVTTAQSVVYMLLELQTLRTTGVF